MAKKQKIKWNKPVVKDDVLTITKHIKGQLDVFFGEGWDNWVRISVLKDVKESVSKIKVIAGKQLTKAERTYLEGVV